MKLKTIAALLFAVPVIAFGETSCYQATTPTPASVPARLCLESIQESHIGDGFLEVESADGSFPAILKITSTSRHNEDRVRFEAKATLADVWQSGCGDGFSATLVVKSEFITGTIYASYMDVSVETVSTNDTCHSRPQTQKIKYELVK